MQQPGKQPGVFSRFADDETEARYNETARILRLPFVRLYCVIFIVAALLGYKITADTLSLGDVTADSSKGPFTYKDASTLAGFGLSNPAVYRGGEPASAQNGYSWRTPS